MIRPLLFSSFTLIFILLNGHVHAQDQFFDGEALDEAWSSAANWSSDTLPGARVVIAGDLRATTTGGDNFTVGDVYVGSTVQGPAGAGELAMDGGTLNANELNTARDGRDGTVTLSNGAILNLGSHLRIARHNGSTGTVVIGGATTEVNVAGQIIVGNNESGSGHVDAFLVQNGGTINMTAVQDFNVANNTFSDGTFTQTAGTLNTQSNMNLGRADGSSTAVVNTAGIVVVGNGIQMRRATWNQTGGIVSNGVSIVANDVNLGADPGGNGTFNQTAGTLYISRNLNLGRNAAQGTGNLDISGTVQAGEHITVNNGTFAHRAGAQVSTGVRVTGGDLNVGTSAGSVGTYLYEGGTLTVGDVLGIGRDQGDGTGHMTINANIDIDGAYVLRNGTVQHNAGAVVAGLNNNDADFNIGSAGSGKGDYTFADGSITIDRNMNLQNGTFTQLAGAVVIGADHDGTLNIGSANGVEGTYDQQGGTLTIANNLNIGGFNLTTGIGHFNTDAAQNIPRSINANRGTYRQTNGDLVVGATFTDGDLNIGDGVTESATVEVLNGNLVVADELIMGHDSALGEGTLTVSGNITTDRQMLVRNGTVNVTGAGSIVDIGVDDVNVDFNLGSFSGGTGIFNHQGAGLNVSRNFIVNRGSYTQASGDLNVGFRNTGGNLLIADSTGEDATFELQNGNVIAANEIYIGRNEADGIGHAVVTGNVDVESNLHLRNGTFTVNTGDVDIGTDNVNADLNIGQQSGGEGTFTFNGGTFGMSRNLNLNKGAFVQSGGTVNIGTRVAGDLNIGTDAGEDAAYIQQSGLLNVERNLNLGQSGFATDGVGTMETHGDVILGGTAQLNRGSWTHDTGNLLIGGNDVTPVSDLFVGSDAGEDATFSFSGGMLNVPNEFNIGRNEADGSGHVSLSGNVDVGTNMQLRNGSASFGGGAMNVGVANVNADILVGSAAGGSATFHMTDGTINIPRHLQLNRGMFTQDSGLVALGLQQLEGDLYIATDANEEATYIQNGGTLSLPDRIYVGRGDSTGTGYMTINATVEAGDDVEIRRGAVTQTGGDFTVGTPTIVQNSSFNVGIGQDWLARYDQQAGNLTVENNLSFGQNNGNGIGDGTLNGQTDVGVNFLFRRGTIDQSGSVKVGTSNVESDFNIATDLQGDATYNLNTGGSIDVVDRMHIGRSDRTGVGVVNSQGDISTGDLLDLRNGLFTQTGGSIAVGQVGANAGNPTANADADFFVGTGIGADATYRQHGGSLQIARDLYVGHGAGDSDAAFEYRGGATVIQPGRNINIRPNATLRTIADNSGISVIETQGAGNINLNGSSNWDVDLAGGVFLSGVDNYTALEASGAVNDSSNFSETIWNRNQFGAEVVVLELSGGSSGTLDMITTEVSVPSAESGFIQIDEYAGNRIAMLMDLTVLNSTSDALAAFMRAGGHEVAVVDADTLRLHLDVPDNDAFFAWDLFDYNVENQAGINVTRLSLQVIPEPSSFALCVLGLVVVQRLRRRAC
ncbi:MAG: hypothetical protein ACI9TH_001207 [Kiritimatiellia bacterium]|jgi:hypothetical protein